MSRALGSILALAMALLCVGCAPEERPLNVVLIVIDTLRWDHVGAYGANRRDISPRLDAFAARAVRFDRAYATAPWTRPSIGSMLTGLVPSSHGGTAVDRPLADEVSTLPEWLSAAGYATRGVISNWVISRKNGFAQGFEQYHEAAAARRQASTSEAVTRVANEMLDALADDARPFFLLVHYFDPHYRYLPHDDVGFADGEVERLAEHPSIFRIRQLGPTLSEAELENLRTLYAEEVRHTDTQVGRLLDHIADLGLEDDTVVAIVSDHGEELFERGYLGHAHALNEELLRVPFLLGIPGQAAAVVDTPVSLVDLAPTLLDVSRSGASPPDLQGVSLAPRLQGEAAAAGLLLAEVDYLPDKRVERTARMRALIGPRYKLVVDRQTDTVALYDLASDPGEREDVSGREPARTSALQAQLARRLAAAEAIAVTTPAVELSDEDAARLRELGYIEGGDD